MIFAKRILEDDYGLRQIVLNTCFRTNELLLSKLKEYIRFQEPSIEYADNEKIVIKLNFGEIVLLYKLKIEKNENWFCVKDIEYIEN